MKPQVTERMKWWEIDTREGIFFYPANQFTFADVVQEWKERAFSKPQLISGYGARLSMPGYQDCTEWCVFDTEAEAHQYLEDMYGDDDAE